MSDWKEVKDDDEIREGQGFLPRWWVYMLIAGVLYGVVYVTWFHGVLSFSQHEEYQSEIAKFNKANPVVIAELTAEGVNPLRGNPSSIAAGQKHFGAQCAACHKPDMTGIIGPNLVDSVWLHGDTDAALYAVIMNGIGPGQVKQKPAKGIMPAHKASLGSQKTLEVLAYIASKNPDLREK